MLSTKELFDITADVANLPEFYHVGVLRMLVERCGPDVVNENANGVLIVLNELDPAVLKDLQEYIAKSVSQETNFNVMELEKDKLKHLVDHPSSSSSSSFASSSSASSS
jgi:hypothetical protein